MMSCEYRGIESCCHPEMWVASCGSATVTDTCYLSCDGDCVTTVSVVVWGSLAYASSIKVDKSGCGVVGI